jgi:hypothetical protein
MRPSDRTAPVTGGGLTLNDFQPGGPARCGADKRREPRTAFERAVRVYCPVKGAQNGRLLDCSPSGVCIVLQHPLRTGDQFLLKLRMGRLRLVAYTVRHCRGDGTGAYRIGGELAGILGAGGRDDTAAILSALLTPAELPAAKTA